MELTLNVDENGRTASASAYEQKNLPIDYSTKALMFDNFNEDLRKQLIHDCEASIAPELPMTFWLSMNDNPRCMLEKMAKKIFNTHVKDKSGLDPKSCGCEWWVQVRPSEGKRINSNSSEAKNGIQFHWDKDETLRDVGGGIFIHPHLSTVTYFTNEGSPTMVFQDSAPDEGLLSRKIQEAFISFPKVGKHLSFDGRFLHGAPSDLSPDSLDKVRVTFLVNIWLHHKPLGVESFPSSMLHTLSNRVIKDVNISKAIACKSILPSSTTRQTFTWGLSDVVNISISLPLSLQDKNIFEDSDGNVRIYDSHGIAYLNTRK